MAQSEHRTSWLRLWRKKNRDKLRRSQWLAGLKRLYGITEEAYLGMLAAQGGLCAICHGPPNGMATNLTVDHCHRTGKVCGLLCVSCNGAIGYLKEDPCIAERARDYILEHK